MVNPNPEPSNTNPTDLRKMKKIVNSKYLNKLREEEEGVPELRVG